MAEPDLCESSGPTGPHVIVTARCCRDWPVSLFDRISRCGLCGDVPEIVPVESA